MSTLQRLAAVLGDKVAKAEAQAATIEGNLTKARDRAEKIRQDVASKRERLAAVVEGIEAGDSEKLTVEILEGERALEAASLDVSVRAQAASRARETLGKVREETRIEEAQRRFEEARDVARKAEAKVVTALRPVRDLVAQADAAFWAAYNLGREAKLDIPGDVAFDAGRVSAELNAEVRANNPRSRWVAAFDVEIPRS